MFVYREYYDLCCQCGDAVENHISKLCAEGGNFSEGDRL